MTMEVSWAPSFRLCKSPGDFGMVHNNHRVSSRKLQRHLRMAELGARANEGHPVGRKRHREGATADLDTGNVCHSNIAGWKCDFSLCQWVCVHRTCTTVAITALKSGFSVTACSAQKAGQPVLVPSSPVALSHSLSTVFGYLQSQGSCLGQLISCLDLKNWT